VVLFFGLRALYVHCAHSLWGVLSVERNSVSFVQLCELNSNERIAVEEEILVSAFCGDKSKTLLLNLLFNYSSHKTFLAKD